MLVEEILRVKVEVESLKKNKTEKQVFQTLKREHQLGELSFKS